MSTRQVRKLAERLQQMETGEVEESQDAFEPLYSKQASSFEGLFTHSAPNSDTEESTGENGTPDTEEAPAPTAGKRKKAKKNKKKRNRNRGQHAHPHNAENIEAANNNNRRPEDLDEVDRYVREINELLGAPPVPEEQARPTLNIRSALLKVDYKNLNPNNEMNRLFGPDDEGEGRARRNQRNSLRQLKRQIGFTKEKYDFTVKGLSMTLIEVKDGVKYFKFEHGPVYQRYLHQLLHNLKHHYNNQTREDPEVFTSNTVEALIENLDLYYQLDEHNIATHGLEQVLYFMQSVAEPSFNYTDGLTRLEYKYVENRPFHVALLKYIHILTNKACHRTALEIAKLMLNLDPTDPLGVIFMIDTLALRAREHGWLVAIYDQWKNEKDAARLFHMRYSVALAMWHLAQHSDIPGDQHVADNLIKLALVKYPNVACMIMSLCKKQNQEVMTHEVFTTIAHNSTSTDLLTLQFLYAKFVWPKWREPGIMEWVTANALEILARYRDEASMKARVKVLATERAQIFRKYPLEIKRHLHTITSMSELLVEGDLPPVERSLSFNPYPNMGKCIDVHRYYREWGVTYPDSQNQGGAGMFRSFVASLVPDTHGGCCDRHDAARANAQDARFTLDGEMFADDDDNDDDLYEPGTLRLDNGYDQWERVEVERRQAGQQRHYRRARGYSDTAAARSRLAAVRRVTLRFKNKRQAREQDAHITRNF